MSKLVEAFDLLDELEATTKRTEKLSILERGNSNEILKNLLYMAYNPFKMYNIVNYGEVTPVIDREEDDAHYESFINHLNLLNERVLTGGEAIATVTAFFNSLTEREYKWYSRVLKKDLRAGITSSTINKAYKGLVPTFDCMLAKPIEKVKRKPKETIIDEKLDGYRNVSFVNTDNSVELFTRNGKPIIGFSNVEEDLKLLPKGMTYDGELIGKDDTFVDMQKLVFRKDFYEKEATFVIFDALSIEEFEAGKSSKTLKERKKYLKELSEKYELENVKFLIGSDVMDLEKDKLKIEEIYERVLTEGYEGIMIKDANSFYECKRSSAWMKLKPFETADLEVIGSYEGIKKYTGKLGGLIVDWKGYEVEVGSGFSDEEREELWGKRNELVGKIIEVQYQNETVNEKGTISLRFPSFKGFREDKE